MANANEAKESSPLDLPLDFDAWAALSARLLEQNEEARLDILAAAELHASDFSRCDEHWSMQIVHDLVAGRMERAQRYGAVCAAELKRRKAPPVEAKAPEPPAASPEPAARIVEPVAHTDSL